MKIDEHPNYLSLNIRGFLGLNLLISVICVCLLALWGLKDSQQNIIIRALCLNHDWLRLELADKDTPDYGIWGKIKIGIEMLLRHYLSLFRFMHKTIFQSLVFPFMYGYMPRCRSERFPGSAELQRPVDKMLLTPWWHYITSDDRLTIYLARQTVVSLPLQILLMIIPSSYPQPTSSPGILPYKMGGIGKGPCIVWSPVPPHTLKSWV